MMDLHDETFFNKTLCQWCFYVYVHCTFLLWKSNKGELCTLYSLTWGGYLVSLYSKGGLQMSIIPLIKTPTSKGTGDQRILIPPSVSGPQERKSAPPAYFRLIWHSKSSSTDPKQWFVARTCLSAVSHHSLETCVGKQCRALFRGNNCYVSFP